MDFEFMDNVPTPDLPDATEASIEIANDLAEIGAGVEQIVDAVEGYSDYYHSRTD